jgi:type IV pilus biogenesis protein CpaD/CtpE
MIRHVMRLLFVVVLATLAGCASSSPLEAVKDAASKLDPIDSAVRAVNASQIALKAHHEGLKDLQSAAERVAVEASVAAGATEAETRANVAKVRAPFTAAWDAYAIAREKWLLAHAATSAAVAVRAAGKTPDLPHVLAAVAELAVAWDKIEATTPKGAPSK